MNLWNHRRAGIGVPILCCLALAAAAPAAADICDRTAEVRDKIVQLLRASDCTDVSDEDLASIGILDLSDSGIGSLESGDFAGLSGLEELNLAGNALPLLPDGLFDGLSDLQELQINNNALTSLSADTFDGLTSLRALLMGTNMLTGLDADLFDGLTSLNRLFFGGNRLTQLPADIFDGLANLQWLYFSSNPITTPARGPVRRTVAASGALLLQYAPLVTPGRDIRRSRESADPEHPG